MRRRFRVHGERVIERRGSRFGGGGRDTPARAVALFHHRAQIVLAGLIQHVALLLARVRQRRELDDGVQRYARRAGVRAVHAHEVRVDQAKHTLVPHDQNRLLVRLELLNQRVEAGDDVQVRFAARVPVPELVFPPQRKLLGVVRLNLLVRHAVAHAGVDLVQVAKHARRELRPLATVLQLDLRVRDVPRGEDCALQRARPKAARPRLASLFVFAQLLVRVLAEAHGVLLPHQRQAAVASDLALEVVLALAVPGQVDGLVRRVQVAQKLHDAPQKEAVDVVDLDAAAAVDQLDETQVLLLHGLVHLLVLPYARAEVVVRAALVRLCLVILVVHLGLPDVALDDLLVRAHRLDEQEFQGKRVELLAKPLAPAPRGVRGVVDGHAPGIEPALLQVRHVVLLKQKIDHVLERGAREGLAQCFGPRVVLIEKLRVRLLGHHAPAVRPHVEHLRARAVEEAQVLRQALRHVRLAPRGQTHHHQHVLLADVPQVAEDGRRDALRRRVRLGVEDERRRVALHAVRAPGTPRPRPRPRLRAGAA
mmetsp:Transcript_8193/g.34777  ORF Transcript_8193/g.34777 Transcript_8193/m.34777 type:complete len:536 (+) Transcript_8193:7-1614(+)